MGYIHRTRVQEAFMAHPKARTDKPTPTDDRSAARRLADVVARIQQDAKRDPRRYLRSTEVPGGGE